MNPNPARRHRPGEPAPQGVPMFAAPPDPDVLRAQERLEALVADPPPADDVFSTPAARDTSALGPPELAPAGAAELHGDDVLAALADLEARLDAAERRAAAAEALARSADTRARAAAARAEDILFALPDLARELKAFVEADEPGIERLTEAIERMRARLHSAVAPTGDGTRVIVIPD